MKNYLKNQKGITLIALVITIIVLIILVAVSIAMLTGENGILTQAKKAGKNTEKATLKEKIELGVLASYDDTGEINLGKLKNNIEKDGGTINGEEFPVEATIDNYKATIDSDGTIQGPGIYDKKYKVTSSRREIIFKNTISKEDIEEETGQENADYQIVGISNNIDGEYITTGAIEGKAGTLEVQGDIENATFKFNLTKFMEGDEEFYCKVLIGDKEKIQKLQIIQGDIVTYEDDFIGIQYSENGNWTIDSNISYSGGTARKGIANTNQTYLNIAYYGKTFDIITRVNSEIGRIRILFGSGKEFMSQNLMFGSVVNDVSQYQNKEYVVSITNDIKKDFWLRKIEKIGDYFAQITVGEYGTNNTFYIDAIRIYK